MTTRGHTGLRRKALATAVSLLVIGVGVLSGIASSRWIGTPFPGFLVLANRVVASVALPHWPIFGETVRLYEHEIAAINGEPLESYEELYGIVRAAPPGSPFTYTLVRDGDLSEVTVSSRIFSPSDYLLFLAYLINGLAIALVGVAVWVLSPGAPPGRAFLVVGLSGGVLALTAADFYGPFYIFRLHALAEAFLPAGILHLTLVFPIDRLRRHRRVAISLVYLLAGGLAGAYQLLLFRPDVYPLMHRICLGATATASILFLAKGFRDYRRTTVPLVRQRVQVVFIGLLAAAAIPAALTIVSGATGWTTALGLAVFTAPLFPLALGCAIVRHHLIDPDDLLKRTVLYLVLTAAITLGFVGFLTAHRAVWGPWEGAGSPLAPLFFTLLVVLLLEPIKSLLLRAATMTIFRKQQDRREVLDSLGASLAANPSLKRILPLVWQAIRQGVGAGHGTIFVLSGDHSHYVASYPKVGAERRFPIDHPLPALARRRNASFAVYDLTEEDPVRLRDGATRAFADLGADLLVPLIVRRDPVSLIGFVAVGRKESGHYFTPGDLTFLSALASQASLSISSALAYQQVQVLNHALERKVEERTEALANTNRELHASVERLQQAYSDLQRSKENLTRAERMAALGRMTAGIAHEMNTPLGASLTSLKIMREMTEEYRESLEGKEVDEDQRHDLVEQIGRLLRNTEQWIQKAAAYIRSLKLHTRNSERREKKLFSVMDAIHDTRLLLSHRLRVSGCKLSVHAESPDIVLCGDPSKLGQVLTNLVVNAIDAYKDSGRDGGEIRLYVRQVGKVVEIRVRDEGTGIPADLREKIFDEFFSTKPLGEGTGLGLAICRDIVTNEFDGSISLEPADGPGTVFLLRFTLDPAGEPAIPHTASAA